VIKTDEYGRSVISDSELAELLYINPQLKIDDIAIIDPEKYNSAIKSLYIDYRPLKKLATLNGTLAEYHANNQQEWFMPQEYKNLDIAKWVLEQCADQNELQRAGQELIVYAEKNLLPLLQYLKYLVDIMRSNNIVWGVGRGSSVASFVLYLIGIHRIHSLRNNLEFTEFMR
jgi:DNA polymerase III alpha subunit